MFHDLLLALAQISLGLAGFAGLVGVFRRREEQWVLQDLLGLRFILQRTFSAMGVSLLPPFLLLCGLSDSASLAFASLALGLLYALIFLIQRTQLRRLALKGSSPRSSPFTVRAILGTDVLMVAAQEVNAAWPRRSSILVAGLFWLLAIAVHQFFVIALSGDDILDAPRSRA